MTFARTSYQQNVRKLTIPLQYRPIPEPRYSTTFPGDWNREDPGACP